VDQLACIMEIMGPPSEWMLNEAQRKKRFFTSDGAPIMAHNTKGVTRRWVRRLVEGRAKL
jgi:hypothetical protein